MAGSVEYRTVLGTSTSIETALRSVDSNIVHLLLEEGFITEEVHDDVLEPRSMLNGHQKARKLVTGIRNKVELSPQSYHTLISHLSQCGKQYESIVSILESKYSELAEGKWLKLSLTHNNFVLLASTIRRTKCFSSVNNGMVQT